MLKSIEKQIKKAWEKTGREFSSDRNPKAVFWTEQAALKYPFYCNLKKLLEKSYVSQRRVALVPEYNPSTPLNAKCGNDGCPCNMRRYKKQMHIDLCLAKFRKEILRSNIEHRDYKYHNMWCFNPQPIVAMEFKYFYKFDKWLVNEDIKKLLKMEKLYKTQLLYLCFATYERSDIDKMKEYLKLKIGHIRSIKDKFRLAVGTLKKGEWKIVSLA